MSYILDALQKSQSEQAAEGVALRAQQAQTRRGVNPWLLLLLVVVLLSNAGVLAWVFLLQDEPAAQAAPALGSNTPAVTAPAVTPAPSTTRPASPPPAYVEPTPAPAAEVAPRPATRPSIPADLPGKPVPRLALRELPAAEQSLYNGFNYSTHIYTDDPSLCAIVIDGQRLQAGDAFKGLKVTAITEQGVVFEENRRGVIRAIEINLLEQWEN